MKTLDSMQNFNVGGYVVDFSRRTTTDPVRGTDRNRQAGRFVH